MSHKAEPQQTTNPTARTFGIILQEETEADSWLLDPKKCSCQEQNKQKGGKHQKQSGELLFSANTERFNLVKLTR